MYSEERSLSSRCSLTWHTEPVVYPTPALSKLVNDIGRLVGCTDDVSALLSLHSTGKSGCCTRTFTFLWQLRDGYHPHILGISMGEISSFPDLSVIIPYRP